MAPQSKPTRLNLPLVPEEVTFIPIRHLGMENRCLPVPSGKERYHWIKDFEKFH